jgi:hypothetical protein
MEKTINVKLIFDGKHFDLSKIDTDYVARILQSKGITRDYSQGGPVAHITEDAGTLYVVAEASQGVVVEAHGYERLQDAQAKLEEIRKSADFSDEEDDAQLFTVKVV